LGLALIPVGSAAAGPGPWGQEGQEGHDGHFGQIIAQLNLTPEQMTQIKAIRDANKTASQAARQALDADRKKLHDALAGSQASDSDLKAAFEQLAQDGLALHRLRFQSLLQIRSLLSPEQRARAGELFAQGHGHGPGGFGPEGHE
jgi:Spy/CpxP family protein refolding chaperone